MKTIDPFFNVNRLLVLDTKQLWAQIEKMDKDTLQNAVISLVSTCRALKKQPHITEMDEAIKELAMNKFEAAPYDAEIKRLVKELDSMQLKMEHYRELYAEADQQRGDLHEEIESLEQEIEELKAKHPGGRPKTSRDIELIIDYINDGHTQKDTAAHFGMSTSTIYKILKDNSMVKSRK